jgi:SEC-C motif-containing protein
MSACPCGSQKKYSDCCEIFHKGGDAPTAEALMRARYSAFEKNEISYLSASHKPGTEDFNEEEARTWAKSSIWKGLEIVATKKGLESDTEGLVEFKASYTDLEGKDIVHHELSSFIKLENKWYYSEGQIIGAGPLVRATPKVGRNEPCSCGSGKKFKKCCG